MKRDETIAKIERIAERVAVPAGLEIVEVELKGSGHNQLLRIFIDKPEGVTHGDCQFISQEVSAVLDAEDPIAGSYELEVSSPGVERKLTKWKDWERFQGQKAKVVLKEPAPADRRHFDGVISRAVVEDGAHNVTVELTNGTRVTFPFDQIDRANLKFEW